ncbi:MAG: type I-C CRISPR-associated protein Cas8c/Csd1, partial [Oscillospiraceae bacterium]|nr:type I-C CRISPR-associated protein Cas8c/Csd1 [Oscillospiraceae bacterium]
PVSEAAAFAYGTALNYLLSDRAHTVRLGDTTVVFWAKGGQVAPQTMMAGLFGAPNVDERDLKAAMDRIAAGKTARWEDEEISPESEFYILGLAPNAARLSVRFFLRDTFGAFVKRMAEHQARLEIVKPQFDSRQQLSFWQLLHETVNPNAKSKEAAPVMAGELIRAVLTGTRYPATLLNCVMLRIRAEREITRGRAAIIKAYYLKNPHPDCPKEVLTMELSTSKNIPYCLGQAFCILEAIQQEANPGINATIKDKYFNSASATPAGVFPILVNLAQKHLRKLTAPKAIYHNRLLTSALAPVGEDYPARLSLAQQGSFQLGYYHATQKRFEKKEEKENA